MKSIVKVFAFVSSSGNGTYQTLLYDDGTTSCDCRGWTQRNPPGGRTCKHTRIVLLGLGEREALSFRTYKKEPAASPGSLIRKEPNEQLDGLRKAFCPSTPTKRRMYHKGKAKPAPVPAALERSIDLSSL